MLSREADVFVPVPSLRFLLSRRVAVEGGKPEPQRRIAKSLREVTERRRFAMREAVAVEHNSASREADVR